MAQPRLSGHVCLLSHKGLSTPATSHPIFVRVCAGNLYPQGGGLASVCTSEWKETGREKCQINWCVSAPCGRHRREARRRMVCLSLTVFLSVFFNGCPAGWNRRCGQHLQVHVTHVFYTSSETLQKGDIKSEGSWLALRDQFDEMWHFVVGLLRKCSNLSWLILNV